MIFTFRLTLLADLWTTPTKKCSFICVVPVFFDGCVFLQVLIVYFQAPKIHAFVKCSYFVLISWLCTNTLCSGYSSSRCFLKEHFICFLQTALMSQILLCLAYSYSFDICSPSRHCLISFPNLVWFYSYEYITLTKVCLFVHTFL